MTSEGAFIASIISQAYADMLGPNDNHAYPAITFLTSPYGRHAKWRRELFGLLNMDGDVAAQRIVQALEGKGDLHSLYSEHGHHDEAVARARARWLHLKDNPAPPAYSV